MIPLNFTVVMLIAIEILKIGKLLLDHLSPARTNGF